MESDNTPAAPEAVTEPSEAAAVAAPAAEAPAPAEPAPAPAATPAAAVASPAAAPAAAAVSAPTAAEATAPQILISVDPEESARAAKELRDIKVVVLDSAELATRSASLATTAGLDIKTATDKMLVVQGAHRVGPGLRQGQHHGHQRQHHPGDDLRFGGDHRDHLGRLQDDLPGRSPGRCGQSHHPRFGCA